ncbi:hypothetical protein BMI90_18495 [Thioclava sp. L04-15]|uniref:hypothetical protein n=1 Tax=Thioclava sp. L04-15 TaxID=1915318 RepID=UPI000998A2BC|nr:hypothetical protein [Thioclava sp. L04-15]OOY26317.1 hypothetical protein BMI90_18495 [Thioclava sp. L04-15]
MKLDEIAQKASEDLHAAYWAACDAKQQAIDPEQLTTEGWAVDLLAEAYDIALRIEEDPLGWQEGRSKW